MKPYEFNIELKVWNGYPLVDTKFYLLLTDEDAVYLLHISDPAKLRKIENPDSEVFADDFQDTITQNGSKYVPLKFKDKFELKGPANEMNL